MRMIILAIPILLLIASNVYYFLKYRKLRNRISEYDDIGTGRYGFYKYKSNNYTNNRMVYVYVKELDRYTDGYSKIKIDKIEPFQTSMVEETITKAKEDFMSLRLTSDIEWLESEDHMKKLRKEKLENLKKIV